MYIRGYICSNSKCILCFIIIATCVGLSCHSDLADSRKGASANQSCEYADSLGNRLTDPITRRDSLLKKYSIGETFITSDSICNGPFCVELVTHYLKEFLSNDSVIDDLFVTPIIQKQRLFFKYNGSVTSKVDLPLNSVQTKTNNGDYIMTLNANVWLIYFIHGPEETYFGVDGTGLCGGNDCPEYTGIYSLYGVPIFQSYSALDLKFGLKDKLNEFGITDSMLKISRSSGYRTDYFWFKN